MWIVTCNDQECGFEEVSDKIYDKYWDDVAEEYICPECGQILEVERC